MIIITVLAVSMDAYVAGISLGSYERVGGFKLLYISSFSFVLPLVAIVLKSFLPVGTEWLNFISACILILLGIKGIVPERCTSGLIERRELPELSFIYMTLLGISLSVDSAFGAVATGDAIAPALPFVLLATHFALLTLGRATAKLLAFAKGISRLASAFLIIMGLLRFI